MAYESTADANRTITAFFDDRSDADEAVERLVSAGISRNSIQLVAGQERGTQSTASTSSNEGGFLDALKDLFMPDEDRYTYAEGLRRGGYLVTVTAGSANYDSVLDILDDEGTIDIGERESTWRSEGWAGYTGGGAAEGILGSSGSGSGTAGASSRDTFDTTRSGSDQEVIQVAAEELQIGKRDVSHGRVRVRSYVVETPVTESVSLREENVNIERRPVDRAITGDEGLFQDRTIELEERSEEAIVAKEARVREELVINKEVGERTETVSDTVRHTEVEIDDERTDLDRTGRDSTGTVDRTTKRSF